MNFQTKKLYILHLKSKQCSRSKVLGQVPASKRPRLEVTTSPSLLPQNNAPYSAGQINVLQSQITQLSQKQKELLQAQITQKQKQVLQKIPYNQLSDKQKDILQRLNTKSPTPAATPAASLPSLVPRSSPVTITEGKTVRIRHAAAPLKNTQSISISGVASRAAAPVKRKAVGRVVQLPSNATLSVIPQEEPAVLEPVLTEAELEFSEDPIAAEPAAVPAPDPVSDRRSGPFRVKTIGNAFQDIANILTGGASKMTPVKHTTATPKETCLYCKKIFSKSGITQHVDFKHKVPCQHCNQRLLKEMMENHIQTKHKTVCRVCQASVVTSDIVNHIDVEHRITCKKCNQRFMKTDIEQHVRTVHEPEECPDCQARFETKEKLVSHSNEIHFPEKCNECDQRFRSQENLGDHEIKDHPKEFCDDCDALFGTRDDLKAHKDVEHPRNIVSFNGGMFMMVQQEEEEEESTVPDEVEEQRLEREREEQEAAQKEKEELRKFCHTLLTNMADTIVKNAMTGTILFSVRFDQNDE